MSLALQFIVAVVVVEAIAEIITESDLLAPLRARAMGRNQLLGIFAECGYCQSVWMGIAAAYALGLHLEPLAALGWAQGLALGLCVHRASNAWHELLWRWQARLPWSFHLTGLLPPRMPEPQSEPPPQPKEEPCPDEPTDSECSSMASTSPAPGSQPLPAEGSSSKG